MDENGNSDIVERREGCYRDRRSHSSSTAALPVYRWRVLPCTMRRCSWVVIVTAVVAVAGCATGTTVSSPVPTATPVTSGPATTASGQSGREPRGPRFHGGGARGVRRPADRPDGHGVAHDRGRPRRPPAAHERGLRWRPAAAPGAGHHHQEHHAGRLPPHRRHPELDRRRRRRRRSRPRTSRPTASPSTSAVRVASPWQAPSTRRSSPSAAPGTTTARTCRVPPQTSPWTGPPKRSSASAPA